MHGSLVFNAPTMLDRNEHIQCPLYARAAAPWDMNENDLFPPAKTIFTGCPFLPVRSMPLNFFELMNPADIWSIF